MTKSILTRTALLAGIALNLGLVLVGGSKPANAQMGYACPPGYYFLANYGCYPFGGYTYYAPPAYSYYPPPAYAYYPPYPYYPQFGINFRFFDRDRDRFFDRGFRDHDFRHR